jgi:hypothetical protein
MRRKMRVNLKQLTKAVSRGRARRSLEEGENKGGRKREIDERRGGRGQKNRLISF